MHYVKHLFFCTNQKADGKICCATSGGADFFTYAKESLIARDLHGPGKVRVSQSGCLGRCRLGPCLVVYPEAVWYTYATNDDIDEIIVKHVIEGQLVHRLLIDKDVDD
jgi:(2Fe-2S) ferredoxin